MVLAMASCGGENASDKAKEAQSETQTVEITDNIPISDGFPGTYEFSDNAHTWILVVENGDTPENFKGSAYIYDKSNQAEKYSGSWVHLKSDKVDIKQITFIENRPSVNFPSGKKELFMPSLTTDWIYSDIRTLKDENPDERLAIKKIK